jgi:hypothetical protein
MPPVADHGPLPRLLLGLTVVTGLVDAFGYVTLGHVFVANMTGNVVFFGFALAGVGGVSVVASLVAILAFAAGAALGGRLAREPRPHRGFLLAPPAEYRRFPSSCRRSWWRWRVPGCWPSGSSLSRCSP